MAWPFEPHDLDFVLQTHAHIGHSGLLPRLCALGLLGPIITTTATVDLLSVMRLDSAFIQEGDRARAQRKRGHRPARRRSSASAPPLYTAAQAEACLGKLQGVAYDTELRPHASVRCRFRDAAASSTTCATTSGERNARS